MKRLRLRTLLLIVCGLVATWSAKAQDVTIEELEQNVSAYTAQMNNPPRDASYYENLHRFNSNYPSIKFNNSLQVGAGAPGLILSLLFFDFGYDETSTPVSPRNFSGKLADARYYETPTVTIPALTLEYEHNVKRWLGLGVKGVVGFKTHAERHVGTNKLFTRHSYVVSSAMFNMRFSWLHRNYVSMYSSLGVGVTSHNSTSGYTEVHPIVDITWVGLQVGRQVYGFAELGGFIGGCFRGGIGVRF